MSSHKFILELSPTAYEDRVNITHGTALKWGDEQATIYHEAIDEALDTLCLNPNIGHISTDLPGEYRLYLVRSHVIVYRTRQGIISVSRKRHHARQHAAHHLCKECGEPYYGETSVHFP